MTPLEALIEELPPDLRQEVEHFARFLLATRAQEQGDQSRAAPNFNWAGAIQDLREEYSSVELQHKISDWRASQA